jgi:RES domain-containing protein
MSSTTWTPVALSSEARALSGICWRMVEAQHHVSTLKIVDSLEEQELLEGLIEDSKPRLPPECRHLHYLLATPFRYGAIYPGGSRFRRAGLSEGVFYASELVETAVAEMAFHRLLFFGESPATPWPANPAEYTAFSVEYATGRAIDLSDKAFRDGAPAWSHPTDYSDCQDLADAARKAAIDVIRHPSVRDPGKGFNLAALTCRAFAAPEPVSYRTWRMHLSSSGVQAICEAPTARIAFGHAAFAADPRIAALKWQRG